MWIKATDKDTIKRTSFDTHLNLLWKSDAIPFYIMDNHLAAAWCWMQECKPEVSYNFFHIDRHNDLGALAPFSCYQHVKDNPHLSIDEYTGLRNPEQKKFDRPAFTWDNYINQTIQLFPDWFRKCVYATHNPLNDGERRMNLGCKVIEEMRPFNIPDILNDELELDSFERLRIEASGEHPKKWIVNLDLDYFFYSYGDDGTKRLMTDDYIRTLAAVMKRNLERIAVITIALSPECCSGWKNALDAVLALVRNEYFLEYGVEFLEDRNLYPEGWHS